MSRELVIKARTQALFNKFWAQVESDPMWLQGVLRDNPQVLLQLLKAFTDKNPAAAFQQVISTVRQIARVEAEERATTQVDALSPANLEWVQETLEYQ